MRNLTVKVGYALRAGAILVIALSLAACSSSTSELTVTPRAVVAPPLPRSQGRTTSPRAPVAIPVYVAPMQDLRLDANAIGRAGNRAFVAREISESFSAALRATVKSRLPLAVDRTSGALVLEPRLHKCYVSNVDVTKAAVVVVEIVYHHFGLPSGGRIYRGRHTSVNWWNSDAEFTGALLAAFDDCLVQIIRDVEARAERIAAKKQN